MNLTLDEALQKGIEAHRAGEVQEADRYYKAILKSQPKHADANHNMGVLAVGVGKVEEAIPFFKTALEVNPSTAQYWLSYIDALIKLDRLADAKAVFDQAKSKGAKGDGFDQLEKRLKAFVPTFKDLAPEKEQKKPNILDNFKLGKAVKLAQKKAKDGYTEEAKLIYEDILIKFPKNKKANEGIKTLSVATTSKIAASQDPPKRQLKSLMSLYKSERLEDTVSEASKLLLEFPNSLILFNLIGVANKDLGRLEEAAEVFTKLLSIKPDFAEIHYNLGVVINELGEPDKAIASFNKAISIKPDYTEAYNNMGNALRELGRAEEAIDAFEKVLLINPNYVDAYINKGNVLKDQNKLEEALEAYAEAIATQPNSWISFYNIGVACTQLGKLDKAIEAYTSAISLKSDFASAHINLGYVLDMQGKFEDAIEVYKKLLVINPDSAEAYNNIGLSLKNKGNLNQAIKAFTKAISIKPDFAQAFSNLGNILGLVTFNTYDPKMCETIIQLLDKYSFARPAHISKAIISLLKADPNLQKQIQKGYSVRSGQNPLEIIKILTKIPLLLKLMSICPLHDLELEQLLKDLRASLLLTEPSCADSPELLKFQSALALQCFTNEYIYEIDNAEKKVLKAIEKRVVKTFQKGKQPNSETILILASYKSLNQYEWCDSISVIDEIRDVYTRQISEPNQEGILKSDIPSLKKIADEVSLMVQSQYEENPYPTWENLALRFEPASISQLATELKIKIFNNKIHKVEAPQILIAGCGTGQHPIETIGRFKNSTVLAVDLSYSSLAYAKRKTERLGIRNIEYMQADILDLGLLEKQFDIIESAGVLHHMDQPFKGWKVLAACLKPGGLMRLGLYSESARHHIVRIREEIGRKSIGSSSDDIKSFRQMIINSNNDSYKWITQVGDFYSLSAVRDLLFHVQEHRFTIPQIKECLSNLGLKFCGFEQENTVKHFRLTNTHKDDPYDLDKWQAYEDANPYAFASMYQFWCQKVK